MEEEMRRESIDVEEMNKVHQPNTYVRGLEAVYDMYVCMYVCIYVCTVISRLISADCPPYGSL